MASPTLADAARGVHTLIVVVHGVGDPVAKDILNGARIGLNATFSHQVSSDEIEIEAFQECLEADYFHRRNKNLIALQANINAHRLLILPLVWSGVRHRAGRWADGVGPQSLWQAMPHLITTCFRLFQSCTRARGYWKLGVFSIAVISILVLALVSWGVFYLSAHLPLWLKLPHQYWWRGLEIMVAFGALAWICRAIARQFDRLGDVGYYVARDDHRRNQVAMMSRVVRHLRESAPQARMVVVGHSLGSVPAAEGLAHAVPDSKPSQALTLLTLGSPLALMARVFPRQVKTPSHLNNIYTESGAVSHWINTWRTSDIIGGSLGIGSNHRVVDFPLGVGGHNQYLQDERLWITVASILRQPQNPGVQEFEGIWRSVPLTLEEDAEFSAGIARLRAVRSDNTVLVGLLIFSTVGLLVTGLDHVPRWVAICAFGLGLAGMVTAIHTWAVVLQYKASTVTQREALHEVRHKLETFPWLMFFSAAPIFVLSLIVYCYS